MSNIDTISDEEVKTETYLMFRNMTEVDRYNPSLIFTAEKMNIPQQILNQIFQ